MNVINATKIKKSFGPLEVLKNINLSVEQGEIVSIIGPSGSGKSTLLRSLINLEKIDGGNLAICGTKVVSEGVYQKGKEISAAYEKLGMVFQNFNLFPHKSVLQNIIMAPMLVNKITKEQATEKAKYLLNEVGLIDKVDAYPCQLSGGQQQRVAIARALALDPTAVLFDEPTSALDPLLTAEILRVIKMLAAQHQTMVIVTHEIEFAQNVSDRIIFMADGVIIEEGGPEMIENPKTQRLREFLKLQ